MRDAFAPSERSAAPIQRRRRLRRDLFLFHRSQRQRTRKWAGHHLEQMDDRGKLSRIELIEELMRMLFVNCMSIPILPDSYRSTQQFRKLRLRRK